MCVARCMHRAVRRVRKQWPGPVTFRYTPEPPSTRLFATGTVGRSPRVSATPPRLTAPTACPYSPQSPSTALVTVKAVGYSPQSLSTALVTVKAVGYSPNPRQPHW